MLQLPGEQRWDSRFQALAERNKRDSSQGGMAPYPSASFTLHGVALADVEVMIYKVEDLNIVQAALPACWLSSEDSGICCVARLQRFGCKLYLAYLFFVGV